MAFRPIYGLSTALRTSFAYISHLKSRWITSLEDGFEKYGRFVYLHPWKFILLPTLLCILFTSGFLYRESELDMEVLYAIPNSLSQVAKSEINRDFPIERVAYVFVVSEHQENILSAEWLAMLDRFWDKVLNLSIPKMLIAEALVPGDGSAVREWLLQSRPQLLDLELPGGREGTARDLGAAEWDGAERNCEENQETEEQPEGWEKNQRNCSESIWSIQQGSSTQAVNEPSRLQRDSHPQHDHGNDHQGLRQVILSEAIAGSGVSDSISLLDVCVKNIIRNECQTRTPLDFYPTHRQWGRPLRTPSYPMLINFRSANGFTIDSILGGIQKIEYKETTEVISATAAAFRIDLDGSLENLPSALAWEQGLISFVSLLEVPGAKFVVKTERSVEDVLAITGQLRGKELVLFIGSAILVFVYALTMSSSADQYRTKTVSTAVGIASAVMAYGGGVGLCHFLGLKHVPPSDSTPFILLAVGVDDVFVLTNAYTMTYMHTADSQTRMGLTLRDAGISICLTTVTNILAFAIGATSLYYSIVVFCVVTSTALIVGFLLVLTVFCGVLALESAREERRYATGIFPLPRKSSCSDLSPVDLVGAPGGDSSEIASSTTRSGGPSTTLSNLSMPAGVCKPAAFSVDLETAMFSPVATTHLASCVSVADLSSVPDTEFGDDPESLVLREDPGDASSVSIDLSFYDPTQSPSSKLGDAEADHPAAHNSAKYIGILEATNQRVAAERIKAERKRQLEEGSKSLFSNRSSFHRCRSQDSPVIPSAPAWPPQQGGLPRSERLAPYQPTQTFPAVPSFSAPNDFHNLEVLVRLKDSLLPYKEVDWQEPKGNVGRRARAFFMNFYGAVITHWAVKIGVLIGFVGLFCFSLARSRHVTPGISVRDVTPPNSYLEDFLNVREEYFHGYGDECIVFFPGSSDWWKTAVQTATMDLIRQVEQSANVVRVDSGFASLLAYINEDRVANNDDGRGVLIASDDNDNAEDANADDDTTNGFKEADGMTDAQDTKIDSHPTRPNQVGSERDRAMEFIGLVESWMQTPQGIRYSPNFKINGTEMSWKFYYWMRFIDNSAVSVEMLQETQGYIAEKRDFLTGYIYTPLALMWENDPLIFRITMMNMGMAVLTMAMVASLLIRDLRSGVLVLVVIVMIDVSVFGFMSLWGLRLNILAMVNLVLSIGFAVDYTAHFIHCYNHCIGETRDARVIEALVLMGLPITNGAVSTYFAVVTLFFAEKFALVVVFRMITLVIGFAFLHGLVLVPVVLSYVGPMHSAQMDVFEWRNGIFSIVGTVDTMTGTLLGQQEEDRKVIRRRQSNFDLLNSAS